jgi:hypothetical protein
MLNSYVPAIEAPDDASRARIMLHQGTRAVHAPANGLAAVLAFAARAGLDVRTFLERAQDWINLEDFYTVGATRGTETADTDAMDAALAHLDLINGGTLYIPALQVPRLIANTMLITAYRRSADSATRPDVPESPNPSRRQYGSKRIIGAGCGFVGSVFEQNSGDFVGPSHLRYVGDGDGLLDTVSAYNVHIHGLMLDNGIDTARFTSRVRSYDSPTESATSVLFSDCVYSMTETVTEGQHWQYDCKHVKHSYCTWLFGEDASGVSVPGVILGEDAGVNPGTLIDGDCIQPSFEHCTMQADFVFRRVQNPSFYQFEFFPNRRIPGDGTSTLGGGRFRFDGDKECRSPVLVNVSTTDNDGIETFFDATGATLTNLKVVGGQIRSCLKGFVLDSAGPFEIGAFFNNSVASAVDIEVLSTATGRLIDTSNHDATVGAGRTAVSDGRTGKAIAEAGRTAYPTIFGGSGMRWSGVSIADDAVFSFLPTGASFFGNLCIEVMANTSGKSGRVYLRGTSSVNYAEVAAPAGSVLTGLANTVLAGTTGTDGNLTVSAVNGGTVYVENRTGGTVALTIFAFW